MRIQAIRKAKSKSKGKSLLVFMEVPPHGGQLSIIKI